MHKHTRVRFSIFAAALVSASSAVAGQAGQEALEAEMLQKPTLVSVEVPALDPRLASKSAAMSPDELVRVLIFLRPSPPPAEAQGSTLSALRADVSEVKGQIDDLLQQVGAYRDWQDESAPDSAQYEAYFQAMTQGDKETLRQLNQRHEELSLLVQQEQSARLAKAVSGVQDRVQGALEALGAVLDFTTIAGNVIVAQVPAGTVQEIAAMDDVARVAEDRLAHGHLNIADDATLVTSTLSGGGLWNNGYDGGLYDPAVVDSGTDLNHPFLDASAGRENHYSWYLTGGISDPTYNDVTAGTQEQWIDDLQGHGSHVMGIVASEGSTTYPTVKGMSFGVDKTVHLKAGWLNTSGRASMHWSDKMWLVDRALNHTDELRPTYLTDEFADDVDGFNLSYGGATTADDPAGGQFWDAVIDDYSDMVVTISAGNSGPLNTDFSDPATSYNAIAVANVDDKNTAARTDDTIRASSTRGPTASGRKKPDIAAPGTLIASAAHNWETATDWVAKTGTSMAAPMVLGVAMDLMDAGVIDEKGIKALLLNTAQKNEPGINFESDLDGWSTAYGWGYMNAWAAYYHRSDLHYGSVTPSGTATDYQLWKGVMRDEGAAGEGRDRATMVWNRHAVYVDHAYPSTTYGLNDLDLRLYNESNNLVIDTDAPVLDNVQQVRVASGAGATDVVVKVYAYDGSFTGVSSEPYALATEEGFVLADPPAFTLSFASMPNVAPGAQFTVNVDVDNTGTVASHNNAVDLTLPAGFSIVSGTDPQNIGAIAGAGTGTATWTVQASTVLGGHLLSATTSSFSYGESYAGGPARSPVTVALPTVSADKVGVHRSSNFFLDLNGNNLWDAGIDGVFNFGAPTDLPVTGDWNGDGVDDVGVRRNNLFFLDLNGNRVWEPGVDGVFAFGAAADLPVTGDWNGDGVDDIGIRRNNLFYIDLNGNRVWEPGVDGVFAFGAAADLPVIGDWNGDGVDDFGIRRNNLFFLDLNGNRVWEPGVDGIFAFGSSTDLPIIGDWNADGIDDFGIRQEPPLLPRPKRQQGLGGRG